MNNKDLRVHHFTLSVACEYGVNEAVILQNIYYWVDKNAANRRHFHDGRYWTYNSADAFAEIFPYFTKNQIQYTLKKLREHGLILVGNYNKQAFDRTKWYALTDKAYELFGQVNPANRTFLDGSGNNPNSILENPEMEDGIIQNGVRDFPTPIPDRNTDRTSDGNRQMETQLPVARASVCSGSKSVEMSAPTLEEVREFVRARNIRVDADRFFETNVLRGWTDKDGRPIHDWRRYLLAWSQYEAPTASVPSGSAADERPERSIEEIMSFYLCDREVAEEMVREGIV